MSGTLIVQPFANSGDVAVPPQTDGSGFVSWQLGYTPDYEIDLTSGNPQAKAVEREVQNALFNILSANQQAWQQLGFSEWYSAMPSGYDVNAMVMRFSGGVWRPYRSRVAANMSDPLTTPANWEYVPSASEALANTPMPSGGPAGAASLIVTAATDFNSFATGTWDFRSDAIASASPNAPAQAGGATVAGMLESMVWANGLITYAVQRYTDRLGNSFFRGSTDGTWTAWIGTTPPPSFSTDVSVTVNLVSATFAIPSASIPDNSVFWVKIANTNNGASTFTPNASIMPVALPILGLANLALQGGELFAGGRAMLVYKADTSTFILTFCSGATLQVKAATAGNQAVTLDQVNALISAAASAQKLYFLSQI